MSEINKRIFTSFFLLLIIFFSFLNYKIFTVFLFILSFITLCELNNIFKKIYKKKLLFQSMSIFFSILYISYFTLTIILFLSEKFIIDKFMILFLLIICISTDIGGYVFGKLIGGKKLTTISPNKTYSGSLGSFFLSLIVGYLFYQIQNNLILININIFIFIILISLMSQIGDLLISFLKRKAEIKDTGSILPGHGGILDRIDGILLAVPIGLILINVYS
ncbi:phosphatidate cytidylyltransferase [Pelagibacterales bacterium SAG-MED17]|nr:phosphatidate cytidylyltransferase [Pelagibacterales bacterium SAG-MED17]